MKRAFRWAVIAASVLFLSFTPTWGQTLNPSQSSSVVNDLNTALQQQGVIVGVLVIVIIFLVAVMLLGLRYLITPLINSRQSADKDIASLNAQRAASDFQTATINQQTVQAVSELVGVVTLMKQEAKDNADGIKANSNANTAAINQHTDDAVQPVAVSVNTAVQKLEEISLRMDDFVTVEHFDGKMKELKQQLDGVIEELKPKTGPLNPAAVPDTPPTPAPVKPKEGD